MRKTLFGIAAFFALSGAAIAEPYGPGPLPGVQGPSSATSGHIATFNGPTGKILQDGGAPATGTVTSITCNGVAITASGTCSTVGQVPGTATNDNASAGNVGEFISSTVLSGSAVNLTSSIPADVTTISLTAGDWDVSGSVVFLPANTTNVNQFSGWVSTTSATHPTAPAGGALYEASSLAVIGDGSGTSEFPTGTMRISLSGTTTVYLTSRSIFTVSTNKAFGIIRARRVR